MDFKTGKLHKIIREFKKGNGSYEINGIDLENTVFLYREKASPFIPIPKGNYRTVSDDNESTLIVDNYINNKAVEFQIISIFNVNASKYLEKFPELSMAVEHTNKIVDDINNIIDYLNSVGVKTDSKYQTQILTPLEPSSTWYMNADGVIETLPLDDFNKKFKEIIENISETADEKAQEQVRKRLETLKEEIENFKNTKTSEILENITKKENDSLKEIEKIRDIAKNEINTGVSSINETSSEVLENIKNKKENYISEITTISNNSKKELESKMPEINNKFNSIAGGQLNPSFIQDVGEKRTGQFYLDRNTGRLYKCIKTTSSTINSTECFKDYSLEAIIKNLESLTETGSNEKGSWFKDKKTGLIIQWGFKDAAVTKNGYEEHIVNLPIPFVDTSYSASVGRNYNNHNISDGKWTCIPFTNDKIKILTSGYTYNFGLVDSYFWMALGR
nr:MAG TPA: putative tail fiber protein [Caudoviricetes sp.]